MKQIHVVLLALALACSAEFAGASGAQPSSREPIEILRPGKFHSSEVPVDSGELWLVLYKKDGVYRAETRPIRISVCEYMSDGGKCVSSDISDSVVLFVKGLRAPRERVVRTARDARLRLYPGEDTSFHLPEGEWSYISALGTVDEIETGEGEIIRAIQGYRLSFSRQNRRQILGPFGIDSESGPPTIEWAGDLDGDGHVDLLVESGGFNSVEWMLYLSSRSRPPDLLNRVASRRHLGC